MPLWGIACLSVFFFFFNDTATTEIYTLSLHDALPICTHRFVRRPGRPRAGGGEGRAARSEEHTSELQSRRDLVCRLLLEKKKKHQGHYTHLSRYTNPLNLFHQPVLGFFFNDTATTEIYTLSLHDALPI